MTINNKGSVAALTLLSIRLDELALETQDTDRELAVKVFQLRENVEGLIQHYMKLDESSHTQED